MISQMRARLRLGVLVQLAFEVGGTERVEDQDAVPVRRVVHRSGGDGAVEHGLVGLARRDDKDVDGGEVDVAAQPHLGLERTPLVGEDGPERVHG